jgi:hypothetical protein
MQVSPILYFSILGCTPWAYIRLWPSNVRENGGMNRNGLGSVALAPSQQKVASLAHGTVLEVWTSSHEDVDVAIVAEKGGHLETVWVPK